MALALDFLGRLRFRRATHEMDAWATGARLVEYLYGLAELIGEKGTDGLSADQEAFLVESIEYAAVRVAIALDGPERRLARWQVTLGDASTKPVGAPPQVSTPKTVAS